MTITRRPDHGGDAPDWNALYAAYAPRLRRVIAAITPPDDIDDVLHNTFLRFMRRLDGGNVDFSRPVWPLLATMARREAVDRLRAARSQSTRTRLGPQVVTHDAAERIETRAAISTTLLALSPRDRRLLLRYELGPQSPAALAEAEGLSTGALRAALSRARRRFRAAYVATGTERRAGALIAWAAAKRGRRPTALPHHSALEFIRFAAAAVAVAAAAATATAHRAPEHRRDDTVAAVRGAQTVDASATREQPPPAHRVKPDRPRTEGQPGSHHPPAPAANTAAPLDVRRVDGRVSTTADDVSVGIAIEWRDPFGLMHGHATAGVRCQSGRVAGATCLVLRQLPGTTADG